jgi:hypothetical protein
MALVNNKLASEAISLEVDMSNNGSPNWVKLLCLTEKNWGIDTNNVEIVTDCNDTFVENLPGKSNFTAGGSGYANLDPTAGEGSTQLLQELAISKEVRPFRFISADAGASYFRQADFYVQSANETSSAGDYLQFDFTLQFVRNPLLAPAT